MVIRSLVLFILILLSSLGFSQISDSAQWTFSYRNSIQIELLGSGEKYSINYERIIFNKNNFKTAAQFGFATWQVSNTPYTRFLIQINQLISISHQHHLEIGLGIGRVSDDDPAYWDSFGSNLYPIRRIGYRFQDSTGRLILRIGYTPLFKIHGDRILSDPWGGFTLGFSF